jgi:acetoin:2,6-dichlorophenolindophenol oxidoreductase subunit beta
MSRVITFQQAINEALASQLERDPTVVLWGEDIVGGAGGKGQLDARGGTFGVTKGLKPRFPDRVLDTPITESAFLGAAVGAAVTGLRPVVEIMFVDFIGCGMDALMNQAAKFRYMFGGTVRLPLVVRSTFGAGRRAAGQHSQSLYSFFVHLPGLKVVVPSCPSDAKGLLIAAIQDDDPVVFLEHKLMYTDRGEVPEEPYAIPLGTAQVVREGSDVTIVAIGRQVQFSLAAASELADEGISCEVVDPRSLSPLDEDTFLASVRKTGRLVIVDEAYPRCGMASEFAAIAACHCPFSLKAPVVTVTEPHCPAPYAGILEDGYVPSARTIADSVRRALDLAGVSS